MRILSEIAQIRKPLRSCVKEEVRTFRVEERRGDHLVELVHFGRLDVDHIKYIEWPVDVPQVHSQVVS